MCHDNRKVENSGYGLRIPRCGWVLCDAVSSYESMIDVNSVISCLTLVSIEDDFDEWVDIAANRTLPVRKVLDRGEKISKRLIAARHKWATEIRGADLVSWTDENLVEAVTSARIVERVVMSDKLPDEKHKRTRSEDIRMEETLRSMGDDTLDRLRKLESSSAEAEVMASVVHKFLLPRK